MNTVVIRPNLELGPWQGLGGAITEATAYNFTKLSPQKQQKFLTAYYGKTGLDYHWGRISIGSNDFCLNPFEYTAKTNLSDFSIKHDQKWVIPLLQKIIAKKDLKLVASPWSPPSCLKITTPFGDYLKPWQYSTYAKYFRKWIDSYVKQGISIDYITPQNEPFANQVWESCLFSYRNQRKLAYKYLVPELKNLNTKILLWDHNKTNLIKSADKLFSGSHANPANLKIAGLCYHWYEGHFSDEMWQTRQKYPNTLMISSEMSCGFSPYNEVEWQEDAMLYIRELFSDINSGTNAFIDWNMLLDYRGGPTYCKNYLKSPIILNETGDDFILTPIYQVLKKFAQLFPVGNKIIRCEYDSNKFVAVAYKTNSGYKIILANTSEKEQNLTVKLGNQKKNFTLVKSEILGGDMWT